MLSFSHTRFHIAGKAVCRILSAKRLSGVLPKRRIEGDTTVPRRASTMIAFNGHKDEIPPNEKRGPYESKTLPQLGRSLLVNSLCQVSFIVRNSEKLLHTSWSVLGHSVTSSLLRMTFFGHFCAGEDEDTIKPAVSHLQRNGIGAILDFAAEDTVGIQRENSSYVFRNREENVESCIRTASKISPLTFAAVKLSALAAPRTFDSLSRALTMLWAPFLDERGRPRDLNRADFIAAFRNAKLNKDLDQIFEEADVNKDLLLTSCEWKNYLSSFETVIAIAAPLTSAEQGGVGGGAAEGWRQLFNRAERLAKAAEREGARITIDAEHFEHRNANDFITLVLAKEYNKDRAVVHGTYQMYLKDSQRRLRFDMDFAQRQQFVFAAKLVRGAYMGHERERAFSLGIPDPIHDTIEATHESYDTAVEEAITRIARGHRMEIMVASHNVQSIEKALSLMKKLQLPPTAPISFGQLLGMSDHISFTLGRQGYRVYKYVPYGKVEDVVPYLIRRAQENSSMLGGSAQAEVKAVWKELRRRYIGPI